MNKEKLFSLIKQKISIVRSDIDINNISTSDSLKDLGVDSMDRAEIIQLVMHDVGLRVPMIAFGGIANLGELIDRFYNEMSTFTK